MKKLAVMCAAILLAASSSNAQERIGLKQITDGEFRAQTISGIDPIQGTDQYAQIKEGGKQIVRCSFKSGEETGVLFDVDNTQGERISSFDGYIMSPDGTRMLICTNRKPSTAEATRPTSTSTPSRAASWRSSPTTARSRFPHGVPTDSRWPSYATTTSTW